MLMVPGVSLTKVAPKDAERLGAELDRMKVQPPAVFKPTHAIYVDSLRYVEEVLSRIESEGIARAEARKGIHYVSSSQQPCIRMHDVIKQVAVCLILFQPSGLAVGGYFSFRKKGGDDAGKEPIIAGYLHLPMEEYPGLRWPLFAKEGCQIEPAKLAELALIFDRYYRITHFHVDGIAIALNVFWSACTVRSTVNAFLNFTTLLEALLSNRHHCDNAPYFGKGGGASRRGSAR